MYWEKIRPVSAPAFKEIQVLRMYPLMKTWTELEAAKRDKYESTYGRAHGKVSDFLLLILV
jgi:hypothetical protein